MRLNATTIRTLVLPDGVRDKVFFCDDLPGFGLRVRESGARTWLVQYGHGSRSRRMSIGSPATLDPMKAREAAKDILAKARLGQDPANDRKRERAMAAHTVGVLVPKFIARQRERVKPRSLVEIIRHLEKHARPLHALPIAKLDRP